MYFWKIDKLNEDLISTGLNQSEGFKYLMANTILYSIAMIPSSSPSNLDFVSGIISIVIGVIGLLFIYKYNGGSKGKQIIERYLSIGWVIGIKFVALLVIPSSIIIMILQQSFMGDIPKSTTLFDVFYMQFLSLIYFLWVAKHINYVAKRTSSL